MKPINVYFEDSEMEALKKIKGDKTWHDIIFKCMKQAEVGEINPFALRGFCMKYDLEQKAYPKSKYEGYSLLRFFLKRRELPFLDTNEKEWQKRLMELKSIIKEEKNG